MSVKKRDVSKNINNIIKKKWNVSKKMYPCIYFGQNNKIREKTEKRFYKKKKTNTKDK